MRAGPLDNEGIPRQVAIVTGKIRDPARRLRPKEGADSVVPLMPVCH